MQKLKAWAGTANRLAGRLQQGIGNYSRQNPRKAIGLIVAVAVLPWAGRLRYAWAAISSWSSRFGDYVLLLPEAHPHVTRLLHFVLNAVPDSVAALLGFAGLAYLMPGLTKRIEKSKRTRIAIAAAIFALMFLALAVNAINRAAQDHKEEDQGKVMSDLRDKIIGVQQQNSQLSNYLLASKGQISEADRRKGIETVLRNEYILSHDPIDPEIVAGNKMPPADWMNYKLKDMGEDWQFVKQASVSSAFPRITPKTIVLKNTAQSLPSKAGDDVKIELKIEVNHNGPLQVTMSEGAAVKPVDPVDPSRQMQMEDTLWAGLMAQPKGVPLQLPSHNEDVVVPIQFKGISESDLAQVKAGAFAYYFVYHLVDARGSTLLDFCAYVDSKGNLTYCRNHNGP